MNLVTRSLMRYLIVLLILADLAWMILMFSPTAQDFVQTAVVFPFQRVIAALNFLYWSPMHWAGAFAAVVALSFAVRHAPGIWSGIVQEFKKPPRSIKRQLPQKSHASKEDERLDKATRMMLDQRRNHRTGR
ncbi:MAG: hypothetical protein AAF989_09215 [Planctomycetota bacterium]